MTKFLNKNEIITSSQFGFRINSSIKLAITTLYDKLLNNLNESKVTLSLFLNLKKAFDLVNHQLLLKKLYHYGFRRPDFADQFPRVPFWAQSYSVYMSVTLNRLHISTISQFICMLMIYSVTLGFLVIHQNLLLSIVFSVLFLI